MIRERLKHWLGIHRLDEDNTILSRLVMSLGKIQGIDPKNWIDIAHNPETGQYVLDLFEAQANNALQNANTNQEAYLETRELINELRNISPEDAEKLKEWVNQRS